MQRDPPHSPPSGLHTLGSRLPDYNHWWSDTEPDFDLPGVFDPEQTFRSLRGDFYYVVDHVLTETNDVVGLSGPPGVGKTTLLQQLTRLFVDAELQQEMEQVATTSEHQSSGDGPASASHLAWALQKYHPELAANATRLSPDQVCYVPLDSDSTNQIRAHQQITSAVTQYEENFLEGPPDETDHVILIDDIHAVASMSSASDGQWGGIIESLLTDRPARTVLVTATADLQIKREFERLAARRQSLTYSVEEITPPKFSDYLQRRHPIYEGNDAEESAVEFSYLDIASGHADETTSADDAHHPDQYRIRSSPLRQGLLAGVANSDARELWSRLQEHSFDEAGNYYDESRIRRCFTEYLLLGGHGSAQLPDTVLATQDSQSLANELVDDGLWKQCATELRQLLQIALHREATSFTSIKKVRNLERLFGWAANTRAVAPVAYDRLQSTTSDDEALFSVDRRTLREKYFAPLSRMDILTPSEAYDNERPTAVRPAPRDPGMVNAVAGRGVDELLLSDHDASLDIASTQAESTSSLRADLAYLVAFDHIVRLSYLLNDDIDPKQGVIKYWESSAGTLVDFIPRFRGAPVPIAVAYPSTEPTASRKRAALYEFLNRDDFDDADRFDPPVSNRSQHIETIEDISKVDGVGNTAVTAIQQAGFSDMADVRDATPSDLTDVQGIGKQKARAVLDAADQAGTVGSFDRYLARLREYVSRPEYMGTLTERTFAAHSESGRATTHYHVVDGAAPFGILLTETSSRTLEDPDSRAAIVELPLWKFVAAV